MRKRGKYFQILKYLEESRNYFLIMAVLFFGSILFGYFFPVFFVDFIKKFVEEVIRKTEGLGFFQLFIFILQNNLTTAFVGIILGLLFGIFPLFFAFFNGYVLGFIANKTIAVSGPGILLKLLPHGIFEIPALILSLGLGLRLGMFVFKKKGKRKKDFIYAFENSLRAFLYVILPLLFIAAFIEAGLIMVLK